MKNKFLENLDDYIGLIRDKQTQIEKRLKGIGKDLVTIIAKLEIELRPSFVKKQQNIKGITGQATLQSLSQKYETQIKEEERTKSEDNLKKKQLKEKLDKKLLLIQKIINNSLGLPNIQGTHARREKKRQLKKIHGGNIRGDRYI